jgi:hypothetical protein
MSRSRPPSERLRGALRELAEADAAEVVAEARERARARAAKLIEDALVDELLVAVERAGAAGQRSSEQAWWAYCVLSARDVAGVPPQLEGIAPGSVVEVVGEGALAALVSAVPGDEYDDVRLRENLEDLEWLERTARRHEAVLEAALGNVTIVPLRLCTLYRDLDGVRRLLREHSEALRDSLTKLGGCVEWGVKVFAPADEQEQEPVPEQTEPRGERPGATYLINRQRERERAERASELRARCVDEVHQRVSSLARESASNPPQRPELHGREMAMLLNGAYLVAKDRAAELREAVSALKAEWETQGFVIELTGPWPAYNFVSGAAGVMP